jgi:hypothetical protein
MSNVLPNYDMSNVLPDYDMSNVLPNYDKSNVLPNYDMSNVLPNYDMSNVLPDYDMSNAGAYRTMTRAKKKLSCTTKWSSKIQHVFFVIRNRLNIIKKMRM